MLGRMVTSVLSTSAQLEVHATSRRDQADPFWLEAGDATRLDRILAAGPWHCIVNCLGVRREEIERTPGALEHAIRVNALFPHQLAAAGRARIVNVSSDAVFAPEADDCDEDSPCRPADAYGWTKRLGEVEAPHVLDVRCSIVGPDPEGRGLLEWLRRQPRGARIPGYTDHLWCGVTSLQFARMCAALVEEDLFDRARQEGHVHHFCPNATVSKHELLALLAAAFRPDLVLEPRPGPPPPCRRTLATRRRTLRERFGTARPLAEAIQALATVS
jgi:dTDP-4-dehydrorhamnose reductase